MKHTHAPSDTTRNTPERIPFPPTREELMTAITLNQALDQAIEQLGPLHKRVLKLRLRKKSYRARLLDELAVKLHNDEDCCALQLESVADGVTMQTMLADGDPEAIYSFDPANLAKFLELIIKYLPQLIAILIPLFTTMLLPFLLLLPSSAFAQCVNCSQPTLAPQQATYSQSILIPQSLPLQQVSVESRRLPIRDAMALRRSARVASRALYPSVSATYSAGSTGTPTTSYGSVGTLQATYSLGSVGTYQTPAPQATYSLGSVGSYSTAPPTYSLGSVGTPTVSAQTSACACVNCNCAPAVFSAPAAPCINCAPAAPITYSVPTTQSVSYSATKSVSYSPVYSPAAIPTRSTNYAIALRSATERAMRGIKGHLSSIERQAGKRVGVGWSSHNPNPATCFNNLPGDYAVARGRDGYYAIKIVY